MNEEMGVWVKTNWTWSDAHTTYSISNTCKTPYHIHTATAACLPLTDLVDEELDVVGRDLLPRQVHEVVHVDVHQLRHDVHLVERRLHAGVGGAVVRSHVRWTSAVDGWMGRWLGHTCGGWMGGVGGWMGEWLGHTRVSGGWVPCVCSCSN